jgi:hypothetical protein
MLHNCFCHIICSSDTTLGLAPSFPFFKTFFCLFNSIKSKLPLFKTMQKSGNQGESHILFFLFAASIATLGGNHDSFAI